MREDADRHREHEIIDAFVELADTLASDFEVGELLTFLVHRCAHILEADVAGVLLEGPEGTLRLTAATSSAMDDIERAELASGVGPCIDAYRTCDQVIADDLSAHADRWPELVSQLGGFGMHAGFAFPIRLRDRCIGALNLYRRDTGSFAEDDRRLAQAFAHAAAIGILQEREVNAANLRAAQLQQALDTRVVIEQAKGIIAERHDLTPAQAFEVIRRHARSERRKVREVSQELLDGTLADIPVD
ncbi:ANTAR domain-containing protein [Euzebya sp.]|uniref:ANTAR domain-containing protein n=1 Tax=Euzebya sp. TaxID=1971409 RepID=UPI0035123976